MADIARLRNIAFVGSHHAGKTTLVEAVLAFCGAIGPARDDSRRDDGHRSRAGMRRTCSRRSSDWRTRSQTTSTSRSSTVPDSSTSLKRRGSHRRASTRPSWSSKPTRAGSSDAGAGRLHRIDAAAAPFRRQQDGSPGRRFRRNAGRAASRVRPPRRSRAMAAGQRREL